VLAQITTDNFFYERTMTNKRGVLAQITINKVQDVIAQITIENFFYERTRTSVQVFLAYCISDFSLYLLSGMVLGC